MPADAVTSLMGALEACTSLRAGALAADNPTTKLVARVLRETGAESAEALQRAIEDEIAARRAALAELAACQRQLCVAAAAIPEARALLVGAWSAFSQRPEFAMAEAELMRRLVADGRSDVEARAGVSGLFARPALEESLAASVRSGYELVQMLANAALRAHHGMLLASMHVRLRAERARAADHGAPPRPSLTEAAQREMTRAIAALQSRMARDPDDPTVEAEMDKVMAAMAQVMTSTTTPKNGVSEKVATVRCRLADAVEPLRESIASGDRVTRAAAATRLATSAEALLTTEVAPLVAAVDKGARRDQRASPADAVAVGGLYCDLLDAIASGQRLAWDAGWSTDIDAISGRDTAASYVAPRPPASSPTVIGEVLAARTTYADPVGTSLVVDAIDGVVAMFAPGLDADAVGLRRGCAVSGEGTWNAAAASDRPVLVVASRADGGGLALIWSVEDDDVAALQRQSWWKEEVL